MDNITWRAELFNDLNGQRTGFQTKYLNLAVGWQHWFSPSVTFRRSAGMIRSTSRRSTTPGRTRSLCLPPTSSGTSDLWRNVRFLRSGVGTPQLKSTSKPG
jgi:hypothetical protein